MLRSLHMMNHFFSTDLSFYDVTAEQKTVLDNVPKRKEGEADEEAKGAAKVRDE